MKFLVILINTEIPIYACINNRLLKGTPFHTYLVHIKIYYTID